MSPFEGRSLVCIRGERLVFTGLDFALPAGGVLLLEGPNGSGKTSLLRVMAGLLRPAGGTLTWDGAPISDDPEAHRARLQFAGHQDAVKPVLTAAENLEFWAGLRGAGADVTEAALQRLGLANLAEVPGRMLSAGQKRRLSLARLLVAPAELWLLDEPTVGLDRESLGQLHEVMASHCEQGGRIVASTHLPIELPNTTRLLLDDFAGDSLPGLDEDWDPALAEGTVG